MGFTDYAALAALILGTLSTALHLIKAKRDTPTVDKLTGFVDRLAALLTGHTQQMQALTQALVQLAHPTVNVDPGSGIATTMCTSAPTVVAVTAPPKIPQAGSVRAVPLVALALIAWIVVVGVALIGGLAMPGCAATETAIKTAEHEVIVCGKQDSAALWTLVAELGIDAFDEVTKTGTPDWTALEQTAIANGKTIGGCAYSQFVASYEAKSATPATSTVASARMLMVAPAPAISPARASLERVRAAFDTHPQWQLANGTM